VIPEVYYTDDEKNALIRALGWIIDDAVVADQTL